MTSPGAAAPLSTELRRSTVVSRLQEPRDAALVLTPPAPGLEAKTSF